VLVGACTSAARPRACVLSEDGNARADVTVAWDDSLSAHVVISSPDGTIAKDRVLRFRPADPAPDRWEAAGLVAAALVTGRQPETAEPTQETAEPRTERARLALGALVGTALRDGGARFGGQLQGAYVLTTWGGFVGVGTSLSRAGGDHGDVSAEWLQTSLGLGVSVQISPLHLAIRPRVDGVLVRESASIQRTGSRGADGSTESPRRWAWDGRWVPRSVWRSKPRELSCRAAPVFASKRRK
jgi:hypothetical protein